MSENHVDDFTIFARLSAWLVLVLCRLRSRFVARLVGCAESSITLFFATAAIAAFKKLDVGPAMPAFFRASSADCGCEKFVTELSAQPTRSLSENEGRSEKVRF